MIPREAGSEQNGYGYGGGGRDDDEAGILAGWKGVHEQAHEVKSKGVENGEARG